MATLLPIPMLVRGCLLWSVSVFPIPQAAGPDAIRTGEQIVGTLEADQRRTIHFAPAGTGPVSISLESDDFHVELALYDVRGDLLAQVWDPDDDGGARHTLKTTDGAKYRIEVAARDRRPGEFRLEIVAGEVEEPIGEAREATLLRHYERAGERAATRGEAERAIRYLLAAGGKRFGRGESDRARDLLTRVRSLATESGDRGSMAVAATLLGAIHRQRHDHTTALPLLDEAWRSLASIGNPVLRCMVLENRGRVLLALERAADAAEMFRAFRETARAAKQPPLVAMACSRLAETAEAEGRLGEARDLHDEALAILGDHQWPAPRFEAEVLLNAGRFRQRRADNAEARVLYDRALQMVPATEVLLRIDILLQRADLFALLGEHGRGRASIEQVRGLIGERGLDFLGPFLTLRMAHFALVFGQLEEAERIAREAISRSTPDWPEVVAVQALVRLGVVLIRMDRLSEARPVLEEAVARSEAEPLRAQRMNALSSLGRLHRREGRLDEARECHERARAIADDLHDVTNVARIDAALAYVALHDGRIDGARRLIEGTIRFFEERGDVGALLMARHTLGEIELADGNLAAVDELLDGAMELLDRAEVRTLDPFDAAGVRSGFTSWGRLAQDLVARRLEESEDPRPALSRGLDRSGLWKGRSLLEGISAPAGGTGAAGITDSLAAIQRVIGPGCLLVEFVDGEQELHAYAVSAETAHFRTLGDREGIGSAVREYVAGIDGSGPLVDARTVAARGRRLFDSLLAPLLGPGGAPEELVIVPTSTLARLPFDSLVIDADGSPGFDGVEFLADRSRVLQCPSTPVLVALARRPPWRGSGRTLLMGDPVFSADVIGPEELRRLNPDLLGYRRLPSTRDEVVALARMLLLADGEKEEVTQRKLARLETLRSAPLSAPAFDLFLGTDANIERLRSCADGYAVIHLATHGLVASPDGSRPGLLLSHEPETLGLFTLNDVLALDFKTELTVLSACGTATGRVVRGEGVQSMAYAFLRSGSRAVVASLWEVRDAETGGMMRGFYDAMLLQGRQAPQALADAKAGLRHAGGSRGLPARAAGEEGGRLEAAHPYFWAPFVYYGPPLGG